MPEVAWAPFSMPSCRALTASTQAQLEAWAVHLLTQSSAERDMQGKAMLHCRHPPRRGNAAPTSLLVYVHSDDSGACLRQGFHTGKSYASASACHMQAHADINSLLRVGWILQPYLCDDYPLPCSITV